MTRRVKAKPARAWAVYDSAGNINNVKLWRENAIKEATVASIPDHWKFLKRQGFTCRQVEIREARAPRSGKAKATRRSS